MFSYSSPVAGDNPYVLEYIVTFQLFLVGKKIFDYIIICVKYRNTVDFAYMRN